MTNEKHPTAVPDFWAALVEIAPESLSTLDTLTESCAEDEWWTWQEALAWVASRDHRSIAQMRAWAQFFRPSAGPVFIIGGQYQIARTICGAAADRLESALLFAIQQGRVATRGRETATGEYRPLETIQWRGRAISALSGAVHLIAEGGQGEPFFHDIALCRSDLLSEFPKEKLRPLPHQAIVNWCRSYLDTGKGNGNKAWEVFRKVPEHSGLSRDDVFRPAWNEAKTKIQ